jgi:peptide/nickel transport system substrate-binding protein
MVPRFVACVVLLGLLSASCAPPAPGERSAQPSGSTGSPAARTLNLGVRYELGDLAAKVSAGITSAATKRLFNASLAVVDGSGAPRPYLAETLPQLNTDSWRVFPDGRMETLYRLRPDLTWHDGTQLTAEDFSFAFRVYTAPGIGIFEVVPQDRIEEVIAVDPRSLLIRWRTPYPEAGSLRHADLEPLPRYLLEPVVQQENPDVLANHSYWSREFVGAGPYRLDRWEPGSHIEGVAFAGHALGKPRIERVVVRFIPDENTMLTNLLANNVDIAQDNSLRFEHAQVLKREWGPSNKGIVLLDPSQPRLTNIQLRPEFANPPPIVDLRVRRALAHSLDKQAIVDGLFDGEVPAADQFLPRNIPYFADLDRGILKYPYDLRRTEELMAEVGYRRSGDGPFTSTSGERFNFEHVVISGSQNERQSAIMADGWRRAGYEVREGTIPAAQSTNGEVRATFGALSSVATGGGEAGLNFLSSAQIPAPANRWRGNNRGGWYSPEYDRLWDTFQTTLDRAERNRIAVQLMRLATEDVAMLFVFHSPNVTAHWAPLRGPEIGAPDTLVNWNIHEWELR